MEVRLMEPVEETWTEVPFGNQIGIGSTIEACEVNKVEDNAMWLMALVLMIHEEFKVELKLDKVVAYMNEEQHVSATLTKLYGVS